LLKQQIENIDTESKSNILVLEIARVGQFTKKRYFG